MINYHILETNQHVFLIHCKEKTDVDKLVGIIIFRNYIEVVYCSNHVPVLSNLNQFNGGLFI